MRRARRLHGPTPPTLTDFPPVGPARTLTVTIVGTGTVKDNRDEVTCPGDCNGSYPDGSIVILTATPTAPNTRVTWTGGLTGTSLQPSLVMDANKAITATFAV